MNAKRVFRFSDSEFVEHLGEWWTEEMEFHNESTHEMNVEQANKELEARGYKVRVVACYEAEDGDELEWDVVNVALN